MNRLIPFPISEKELCDRFERTWTPAVNDVLRELGYLEQTLPNSIMPLREHMHVCGIAFTIKGSKNLTQEGEMEKRADMLEALGEDTVAVWDTTGDDQSAQWGEIMTMAAKAHLRNGRPLCIAFTTNDGLSVTLQNVGTLLTRKNVYFVPFHQDDPMSKPNSLAADFTKLEQTFQAAVGHNQLQPLLVP